MCHVRPTCFAVLLIALTAGAFPTDPPARAAEPKEVRFTRAGLIACPNSVVSAGTTGFVKRILVREGEVVKVGTVLVELEDPDLESDLKLAEAELALAVATEKEFVATKGGKVDASPAKEQLAKLTAQVTVAEARLGVVRNRAKLLTVTSRIAGTVGRREVDLGNYVRKAETELFTIFDLTRPEAVVDVPELDVEAVSKKQRCTIRVGALTDLALTGTVERIEPVIREPHFDRFVHPDFRAREAPRTFRVYVAIQPGKEQDQARLVPGLFVQVGFGKPE